MKLIIDSGDETFNMLLEKFQENMQKIKPDIPSNILHIACYDYLKEIQQGRINDVKVLQKHLPDEDISYLLRKFVVGDDDGIDVNDEEQKEEEKEDDNESVSEETVNDVIEV